MNYTVLATFGFFFVLALFFDFRVLFSLSPLVATSSVSQAIRKDPPTIPRMVPITMPPKAPIMDRIDTNIPIIPNTVENWGYIYERIPTIKINPAKRKPTNTKLPGMRAIAYNCRGMYRISNPANNVRLAPQKGRLLRHCLNLLPWTTFSCL